MSKKPLTNKEIDELLRTSASCTLYAWRYAKKGVLICFNCRNPYYEKGMSSGDIHRLFKQ